MKRTAYLGGSAALAAALILGAGIAAWAGEKAGSPVGRGDAAALVAPQAAPPGDPVAAAAPDWADRWERAAREAAARQPGAGDGEDAGGSPAVPEAGAEASGPAEGAGAAPPASPEAPQGPGDVAGREGAGGDSVAVPEEPEAAGREEAGDAVAPEPAPAEPLVTPAPAPALAPRTLVVAGVAIPYRDVRGGTTPAEGGGLWLGSDRTDDGSWGYFVGHNPGSFAPVASLENGDAVVLCDSAGNDRTYTVRSVFAVEATATWKAIASRVTGYGESVILQTCLDGATNLIAVAA